MRRTAHPGAAGGQVAEGGGLQQRGEVVGGAGGRGQTLASIVAEVRPTDSVECGEQCEPHVISGTSPTLLSV